VITITVWILVTHFSFVHMNTVEDFPTKERCEYARLANPDRQMSECTPVNIKVRKDD
jgi:hypothetical protein